MQRVKPMEANKEKRSGCVVTSYSFEKKAVDLAVAEISGRYPTTGFCVNEQCDEVAYIFEGKGTVSKKSGDILSIGLGDSVFISKGEPFFWEGKFKMIISCSPAWFPKQYKNIEG